MKKIFFSVLLFIATLPAFSQTSLRALVSGANGVSKHFIDIASDESVSFNSTALKTSLDLSGDVDFVLMEKFSDSQDFFYYRYYQTYNRIPIENSMCIVHTQEGRITALAGAFILDFSAVKGNLKAGITKATAVEKALQYIGAKKYAWQDQGMESGIKLMRNNPSASYLPDPAIVWYNNGTDLDPHNLKIAYKVDVYSLQPLDRKYVFIDAETGDVLGTKQILQHTDATGTANTAYSGTQTIHSDLNGASYRLRDLTKGNGVITLHGESGSRGTEYTSTSANWTLTGTNQAAMDAHYGVSQTYSFYKNQFNRNSYNNAGAALFSYVNDPTYTNNAFWDGSAMNFNPRSSGAGGGTTSIDVTGHELTHAVTGSTSNLNYSNEPGAINESMSDIMGKSVQFWSKPSDNSWLLGNDMGLIFRNMANPNDYGQPDTYLGTNWYTGTADFGGVHTNSGVGNFMFYLLVTGGNGTNDIGNTYSVTGIGLAQADQIIYKTETTGLGPNSTYADWRTACINASTSLYGAASCQTIAVMNAWYAVGVGNKFTGFGISGYNAICSSSQYSVTGTPAGSTVAWSTNPTGIISVPSSGNPITATKTSSGTTTLTAVVNGCATVTLPLTTTSAITNVTSSMSGSCRTGGYQDWYLNATANIAVSSWLWTKDNSSVYMVINSPNSPGTYVTVKGGGGITITAKNQCNETFKGGVTIWAPCSAKMFTVTPNPASNIITIKSDDNALVTPGGFTKVQIVDKMGILWKQVNYGKGTIEATVSVSDLKPDVYVVKILQGQKWYSQQIIIKR